MFKPPHIFLTPVFLLSLFPVAAQRTDIPQKDMADLLFNRKQTAVTKRNDSFQVGRFYPSILPIPGYNPALGFVLGAGVSAGILTGNQRTTHVSNLLANITVTTKNQVNANFRSNIFLKNDRWILQGDWRWLLFSQPTYGLGVNFSDPLEGGAVAQDMNFKYARFYENVYRHIKGHWFAGVGLNVDWHYDIRDKALDTVPPGTFLSAHYDYSLSNQLPTNHYTSVGLSMNILFDSRDNSVNPQKGHFAQVSFRANREIFGSTRNNNTLYYEYRGYINLAKKRKQSQILGFWTMAQFVTSGKQPYLEMPAISWDMYNRTGRGYVQGRIRGENMWYGESEYRFPVSRNGFLGGVTFVNLTTASNDLKRQLLSDHFAIGYGAGIRLKLSKLNKTNIAIDYGRGQGGSAIYFNLQETF
ncbi:MAG: BamA/TamA family outer membrane protein [Sediminibacterium sp.]